MRRRLHITHCRRLSMSKAIAEVWRRRWVCCYNWCANVWWTIRAVCHTTTLRLGCELMMVLVSLTTSGDWSERELAGDYRTYHAV